MNHTIIKFFLLIIVSAIYGQCFASEADDCTTVKLDSYGKIAIHKNLLKGGPDITHLLYNEFQYINLIPPSNGILVGGIYVDRLTLNWDASRKPKPKCELVLLGTMAGNYYNCFIDWQDKPLAAGILIHTQVSTFDLDGLILRMKEYVEKEFLSCPQDKTN